MNLFNITFRIRWPNRKD